MITNTLTIQAQHAPDVTILVAAGIIIGLVVTTFVCLKLFDVVHSNISTPKDDHELREHMNKSISNRIKAALIASDLTVKQLSAVTNIELNELVDLINAKKTASMKQLGKIGKATNLHISYFFIK